MKYCSNHMTTPEVENNIDNTLWGEEIKARQQELK